MDLYTPIFTRASGTKYDTAPLPQSMLDQIEEYTATIKPLVPDVTLTHRIISHSEAQGLMLPNAPHFLLISGPQHPLRDTSAGFVFQHTVLYMCTLGLAPHWLSSVKSRENDPNHIVGFAFGKPTTPAVRPTSEFKRKPLSEISQGADSRLEAVRLAPSGMNGQPWYFIVDGDTVHVYYRPRLPGLLGRTYHMTSIDIGIALAHLDVASEHEGKPFNFAVTAAEAPSAPKGFDYVGTVK